MNLYGIRVDVDQLAAGLLLQFTPNEIEMAPFVLPYRVFEPLHRILGETFDTAGYNKLGVSGQEELDNTSAQIGVAFTLDNAKRSKFVHDVSSAVTLRIQEIIRNN